MTMNKQNVWKIFGLKQTLKESNILKDIFYGRICKLAVIGTIIFIALYLFISKNGNNINQIPETFLNTAIVSTMGTIAFSAFPIKIMIKTMDKKTLLLDEIPEINRQKLLHVKKLVSYFYVSFLSNVVLIFFLVIKLILLHAQIPKTISIILLVMTTFSFLMALLVNSVFFVNLLSTFLSRLDYIASLVPITACMIIIITSAIAFVSFSMFVAHFLFQGVPILMQL